MIIHAEKRVVHGETTLMLDTTPVPVFTISPNHGKIGYKWEKKRLLSPDWICIDVPERTCLLFVDEPGKYRSSFENESIVFEVKRSPRKNIHLSDG